jgi:hypothetical protein
MIVGVSGASPINPVLTPLIVTVETDKRGIIMNEPFNTINAGDIKTINFTL